MFEIASWWKHKHKQVFCKKMFGFIFSFIGKWNCTSNDFSANFHQNTAENILLGRNLRGKKKDHHRSVRIKLYGLAGTLLMSWYHLAPSIPASLPECEVMVSLSLTSVVSVGWQPYPCPFNPAYVSFAQLCFESIYILASTTCSAKVIFLAVLNLLHDHPS